MMSRINRISNLMLWIICVLIGWVLRAAMVSTFHAYSSDGRLLIPTWQLDVVSIVPWAVAFGIFAAVRDVGSPLDDHVVETYRKLQR